MNIPYKLEELLSINADYKIVSFDNDILIIDDWYKNYDSLYRILEHVPVPAWKRCEGSRNFIDYYDCRPELTAPFVRFDEFNFILELDYLIRRYYNEDRSLELIGNIAEFNFFKHNKTGISNNLQHHPHSDHEYICLTYLDKVCSGGTALYPDVHNLPSSECMNVLYDVSELNKIVIPSKPNRLVIFKGTTTHGGYISDHSRYVNNWRMNHIVSFKVI